MDTGDRVIDLQRSLLTSLVDSDGLNQVKRSGIDQSFFEDSECKQVYAYIERHYAEYKKVPARVAVRQLFPNFGWAEVTEPLEFYIKQMKEAYRVVVLEEALLNINTIYNKDTQEAEAKIRDLLLNLAVTQKSFKDLNLVETSDERWDAYEARKANGVAGILSNWGKIDYETLGWHNGDFAVLVGQKYSGKSWLMLWLAHQAMKQGERVLFCTKEMTGEELADRYDSIYAGVTYDDLRRAELTTTHEAKFQKALTEQGKLTGEGSITMARSSVHTIADIEQKAVEVDATIVFIDSVYLFDADRDSPQGEVQRRMAISQRCKRTAQELDIPVIVSTQAGRRDGKAKQPSLDNIEWSNAFSQDANVVMELDRDDIDKELNQGWVYLLKCRQGQPTDAAINMDFTFMKFDQKDIQKEPTFEAFSEEEKEDVPWMS